MLLLTFSFTALGASAHEGVPDSFWYLKQNPLRSQNQFVLPVASPEVNTSSDTDYRPFRFKRRRARDRNHADIRRSAPALGQTVGATENCESCRVSTLAQPATLTENTDATLSVSRDASELVLDDALLRYQNSQQVAQMISEIKKDSTIFRERNHRVSGSKESWRSIGRCLMYVKFAMKDAGFFRSYPGTAYAANFGPELREQGFINLMDDDGYDIDHPDDAPIGSIIVYERTPGSRTPGHIEVKLGPNEYGSDYIADEPISDTTSRRRIIGIYAKVN